MISNLAVIDPSVKLGKNVTIGHFSIVGPDVEIGENTYIGSYVIIQGPIKIGKNNKFYQFSSIGESCQDKKYCGEVTKLEIGDNNIFRENCTIHRGTKQGGGITVIGSNNLFMVSSHIAHDCKIGNHVIFSNGASVAGHVIIDDHANLGGFVGVHQFCSIGTYSFIAAGAIIYKDVLPFTRISGYPSKTFGLNIIGLSRNSFNIKVIEQLRKAYRIVFHSNTTVKNILSILKPMICSCKEVKKIYVFLEKCSRGIIR